MSGTGIGAPVRRKEDFRFITGRGQYTDDINRPGQSYIHFLRSPHAHAKIKAIDAKACFVGAPVAVVIAETLEAARDAAEKVTVDYDLLPAVSDLAKAQAKDA